MAVEERQLPGVPVGTGVATRPDRRARQRSWLTQTGYFLRRWPVIPLFVIVVFIITAIFAPLLAPHDTRVGELRARAAPPIWNSQWYEEHPLVQNRYILGADQQGRDILSRIIHGARISLMVATISLAGGVIVGTGLGLIAGYYGGLTDELVSRGVDVWNALPFLLIAILAAITFGQSLTVVMVLLALSAWAGIVRNVRAEVLSLRTLDYIQSARISGASGWRIMIKHLMPGVMNTVVVLATLRVGGLILAEASLSYLGAGVPLSLPTWGNMVSDGSEWLTDAWWIAVFPGLAILLVVMSVNFVGDWLRDRFDPRLRQL
jgi:peptide/nickel transport system permease protein